MLALLLPLIAFCGLIAIYYYGRRHRTDQPSRSFSLLMVILLVIPLGWNFGIGIGPETTISIPLAFFGIVIFLAIERHQWHDFYITRNAVLCSLIDGISISVFLVAPFSLFLVCSRVGHVTWLSNDQIPRYLMQTAQIALFEELVYRGLFLGYLRRFSFSPIVANLIQTAYFGVLHLHHLGSKDYLLVGFVLAFSLLQGCITMKRKTLVGALLVHTTGNFIPLLLNNGHVPSL